jgi:hypothetical protein
MATLFKEVNYNLATLILMKRKLERLNLYQLNKKLWKIKT